MGETGTATPTLGERLRKARELKGLTLSAVARAASISTAYLQKLEVGDVRQPSPNVLYKLSTALTIEYAELMRLAGYVVPNGAQSTRRRNELTHALSSEELTEEEAEELAQYLSWYRSKQRRTG